MDAETEDEVRKPSGDKIGMVAIVALCVAVISLLINFALHFRISKLQNRVYDLQSGVSVQHDSAAGMSSPWGMAGKMMSDPDVQTAMLAMQQQMMKAMADPEFREAMLKMGTGALKMMADPKFRGAMSKMGAGMSKAMADPEFRKAMSEMQSKMPAALPSPPQSPEQPDSETEEK